MRAHGYEADQVSFRQVYFFVSPVDYPAEGLVRAMPSVARGAAGLGAGRRHREAVVRVRRNAGARQVGQGDGGGGLAGGRTSLAQACLAPPARRVRPDFGLARLWGDRRQSPLPQTAVASRTILPMCALLSMRVCASQARASGNVACITGATSPASISGHTFARRD